MPLVNNAVNCLSSVKGSLQEMFSILISKCHNTSYYINVANLANSEW